uniref:Uncharacterized protein n=1 Tax=Arundo donax TaxID=35708 RepID=A0A0A9CBA5_ARUDO
MIVASICKTTRNKHQLFSKHEKWLNIAAHSIP